jgi:hypothetical protein
MRQQVGIVVEKLKALSLTQKEKKLMCKYINFPFLQLESISCAPNEASLSHQILTPKIQSSTKYFLKKTVNHNIPICQSIKHKLQVVGRFQLYNNYKIW